LTASAQKAVWGLLSAAVAVLVYLPSLDNGFAWDDTRDVQENEAVHGTQGLWSHVVTPYRTDVPAVRSPYRPLTSISFALSWQLGDGSPGVFHAWNVVLHAIATTLVFVVLLRFGFEHIAAGFAAMIFAAHPVHTEAVANVVGRADVMMTIWVLLGVVVYLNRTLPRPLQALCVCGAGALALLTKENGIALLPLLVAAEVFATDQAAGERSLSERLRAQMGVYVGLVGVIAAYLVLRYSVIGTLAQLDSAAYVVALGSGERLTTAVANLSEVLRLLLFPAVLAADYGPAVVMPAGAADARFWLGLLVGVGPVALAFLTRRRFPWLGLSVAWAALSFLVVSNLAFPVGIWLAERTLHLPSVAVSIAVAGGLTGLARSADRRARIAQALVVVLIAVGSWRSWARSPVWFDSESVVRNLFDEHPESYRAQWWLGGQLVGANRLEEGLRWYRSAVELNPNQALVVLDFTRALILAGEAEEAERRLLAIPAGLHASRSVYLAQSLIVQGRADEAREVVMDGLRLFPADARLQAQAERLREGG
jgi:tetratricopeptide (TPR) repeat protein